MATEEQSLLNPNYSNREGTEQTIILFSHIHLLPQLVKLTWKPEGKEASQGTDHKDRVDKRPWGEGCRRKITNTVD